MINVIVGTKNPQTMEAVREAFNALFSANISVKMHDVRSDVPKHPINYDIMKGADNRIRELKKLEGSQYLDYLVSVEDGIIRINKRYYYMYYVMIENVESGKKSTGTGQLLEIPSKHVALVMKTSVANLFSVLFGNSRIDGISMLTSGKVERMNLIYNGTLMALAGQVNQGTW